MLMARAGLRLLEGVESGGEERKEKEEKLAESNGVKIRDQRRRPAQSIEFRSYAYALGASPASSLAEVSAGRGAGNSFLCSGFSKKSF